MKKKELLTTVTKTRGRPRRTRIESRQTRFWAYCVSCYAQCEMWELEAVLGEDGKWEGLWSRYARGLVSPSKERLQRIGKIFPATEKVFTCPIWYLTEDREYRSDELRDAAMWLAEPYRSWFIPQGPSMYGKFWLSPDVGVEIAHKAIAEPSFYTLTVLVLLIRIAQMKQDGPLYLGTLRCLGIFSNKLPRFRVFDRFPLLILRLIANPAVKQRFADTKLDKNFVRLLKSGIKGIEFDFEDEVLDFFAMAPRNSFVFPSY